MRYALLLALIPLTACSGAWSNGTSPSGLGATRSYAVDGFTAVDAMGPDDVDVRVGPAFSIRAEGDPKELDKLVIARNGDTLEIRRKSDSGFHWNTSNRGVKIFVTMPKITAASATGSGDMGVDKVDGDSFKASVTGSGNLKLGTIKVQSADLSIRGSGNLTASGTTNTASLTVKGSGDMDAGGLSAASAEVDVMGSGNVTAAVHGPAKVDMMGSGDVTLSGGAQCTTSKLGSGDVSCS